MTSDPKDTRPEPPMGNQSRDGQSLASKLRLTGRIMGIAELALLFLMLVVDAIALSVDSGLHTSADALLFGVLPVLVCIASFGMAWRFQRPGAVGVIGSYVLLCLSPSFRAVYVGKGFTFFPDMWLYALPLVASGVLLLAATCLDIPVERRTEPHETH